jgi:glycosyltransferase involved in cell wall biosynthesis
VSEIQSLFSLSLCICTRNRPEDLRRCLQSVADGGRLPDQVIVSDDGDAGKTVEEIADAFPFVMYLRGPKLGLGANRNACIALVTSRYVAFVDDDVVVSEGFIEEARRLSAQYADRQPLPILTGVEYKHTAEGTSRVEPGNADFWGFQRLPPNGTYRAIVINASIFPAVLFRQALFDSQLRYGSDEIDIARHATALGYPILFEASLHVDHYPSAINRADYAGFIDASRLYATAKDYWFYQKDSLKTIIFVLLAPLKLTVGLGRRFGLKGVRTSLNATALAARYAVVANRR